MLRRGTMVLATLVLVAAVAPFVVFAVPQVVGADEGFVVLSGSMEPALSPGDVVILDASTPIRAGDVITYQTAGSSAPTTHRVISEAESGFETKGDANENTDAGTVPPEAVIGEVVLVIPLIGHVILWANTPVGFVALVVVPLVLLGISELVAWARRKSTDDEELIPAVRRIDESATPPARPDATSDVALAVVDLKLTVLAMGALFAYAGWNVYREYLAVSAPDPVSVGALTAGLLGLLFAGWVTITAWRTSRRTSAGPATSTAVRGDGGVDTEEDHE